LEIIVCRAGDWAPTGGNYRMVTKDSNTTAREFRFLISQNGGLKYEASTDGTAYNSAEEASALPFSLNDPGWVRVVHNLTGGTAQFYTGTDPVTTDPTSVSWSTFGTSKSSTTSISNEASILTAGGKINDVHPQYYGMWLYYDGSEVANPDPRTDAQGWSSAPATDDHGNSWALTGGATWVAPVSEDTYLGNYLATQSGLLVPNKALLVSEKVG
jgi:hypothetical protein